MCHSGLENPRQERPPSPSGTPSTDPAEPPPPPYRFFDHCDLDAPPLIESATSISLSSI